MKLLHGHSQPRTVIVVYLGIFALILTITLSYTLVIIYSQSSLYFSHNDSNNFLSISA